jgi:hypothetical protein
MRPNASWLGLLGTAAAATIATTAAGMLLSFLETRKPAAGLNAVSHILWGDEAARVDRFDVQHTLAGGVLNAGAMASWAAVNEMLPRARGTGSAIAKGALVSALAYLVDYYVVPKRLTPGFEKRFSPPAMLALYATLAAGLALGEHLAAERQVEAEKRRIGSLRNERLIATA